MCKDVIYFLIYIWEHMLLVFLDPPLLPITWLSFMNFHYHHSLILIYFFYIYKLLVCFYNNLALSIIYKLLLNYFYIYQDKYIIDSIFRKMTKLSSFILINWKKEKPCGSIVTVYNFYQMGMAQLIVQIEFVGRELEFEPHRTHI